MKKAILVLVLLLVSCDLFMVRKNSYYTKDQFKMLEKSAGDLNLDFGYDSSIDLNYFYEQKHNSEKIGVLMRGRGLQQSSPVGSDSAPSKTEVAPVDKDSFYSSISEYPVTDQFHLLTKVYFLYERTLYMKHVYEKTKSWRNYNILNLEYSPAIELYYNSFHDYFKQTNPKLYSDFLKQKDDIRINAITEVQKEHTIVDEY
ncbi:MAG: hypothetical protein PF637_09965 [Spirochaetes bacterium]|jgi:hypothetical protein|nr:hypothetical protein [Spirochaetota bacterium]